MIMKTKWTKALIWVSVLVFINLVTSVYSDPAGKAPKTPKPEPAPKEHKVIICHKGHTIEVGEPALRAHLEHGDTIGSCSITPNQNR